MSVASITVPRWAVSTRTRGEISTAGFSTPALEIVLLGLPAGLDPADATAWLGGLAGAADETARTDQRERPLPALLFHALNGLLFSEGEVWSSGPGRSCAVVFAESPSGAAFGWTGEASADVLLDGEPYEPQWVVVRDASGREARGAWLPARAHALVAIDAGGAAGAEVRGGVEAEWTFAPADADAGPQAAVASEAPAEPAAAIAPRVDAAGELDTAALARLEGMAPEDAPAAEVSAATEASAVDDLTSEQIEALGSLTVPHASHPVARWLGRMFGRGARPAAPEAPPAVAPRAEEGAPLSRYDSLLSEAATATPSASGAQASGDAAAVVDPVAAAEGAAAEQTVLELAAGAAARAESASAAAAGPPASPAMASARARLVRAMHEADAGALPVLRVETPAAEPGAELEVVREPEGADAAGFGIAPLPEMPARAGAPAADAGGGTPEAPPVLRVELPATGGAGEVLRIERSPSAHEAEAPDGESRATGAGEALRRRWPVPPPAPARRLPRVTRGTWAVAAIVACVFAAGWGLGSFAGSDHDGPGPLARALRAIGLGGARYTLALASDPAGAWIAVDGKDLARRTPADLELAPGAHVVTLSLPDLGGANITVRGRAGERLALAPSLDGTLSISSSDTGVPVSVALDGRPLGYLPQEVAAVAPGLHELQFAGAGMPGWAQTVQVGVRRTTEVVAHPSSAPATGVLEVQATMNDERGSTPLAGAQVFVDGEMRARTPAHLDLPRGPHTLRVTYRAETAPVQLVDLPGGNVRYTTFAFGLDTESPQVVLMSAVRPSNASDNAMVTATVPGLRLGDVREAALHVRGRDGLWRAYPMTAMRGARGPVVVCVFPPAAFEGQSSARWYVSVATAQGDEVVTEMQTAVMSGAAHRRRRAPADGAPPPPSSPQ